MSRSCYMAPVALRKKLEKLIRSPRRFVRDLVKKRRSHAPSGAHAPRRGTHSPRFSVVSAVFDVEPYLARFFESLTAQSLGFAEHIEVVLVDDGSGDASAAVIAGWATRYPDNIRLVRKARGGQASARNAGLAVARGEWVTFIDPDDWVSDDYFARVQRFIEENPAVAAVCCKPVFFREATGKLDDGHPLRGRFVPTERVVDLLSQPDVFNHQTATAFLRRDALERHALRFDERVKPTFEDGKLFNEYLLACSNFRVGFLGDVTYFYRKRARNDSSLDTSWSRPDQFTTKLEHGYLAVLTRYQQALGHVPAFLQNLILYDLSWYLQHLINHDERIAFLSDEESARFEQLLVSILAHVEPETLEAFDKRRLRPLHVFGLRHRFMGLPGDVRALLELDQARPGWLILYVFVTPHTSAELEFHSGAEHVPFSQRKVVQHRFNRRPLATELTCTLDMSHRTGPFELRLAGTPQTVAFKTRNFAQFQLSDLQEQSPQTAPGLSP